MTAHTIGEISLNISTAIYFIWFIPQLLLNFRRRSTSGLSLWMHALLVCGYMTDLMYGFGRHMPIQYRMVTVIGLISLTIEHYQFARYGLQKHRDKITYLGLSLFFAVLILFAIYNITVATHSKRYYDIAGLISFLCWFTYFWPQIIKNFLQRSATGLSTSFVLLSVISGVCDLISAFALGYDWPSKLSAPLGLIHKGITLSQCFYYNRKKSNKQFTMAPQA